MVRNNFDKSSTGLNVEVNICNDLSLAQINFNENIEEFEDGYYIYTNYNNLKYYYKNIYKMKSYYTVSMLDINDFYDIDINDRRTKVILYRYLTREYKILYSDLKDGYVTDGYATQDMLDTLLDTEYSLVSLEEFLNRYSIPYKSKFTVLDIRGYSQGDYAQVIIMNDALSTIWGSEPNIRELEQELTHFFYDAPQSVSITINGDEFISQKYDGYYDNYDKQGFTQEVMQEFSGVNTKLLLEILNDLVPEECTE